MGSRALHCLTWYLTLPEIWTNVITVSFSNLLCGWASSLHILSLERFMYLNQGFCTFFNTFWHFHWCTYILRHIKNVFYTNLHLKQCSCLPVCVFTDQSLADISWLLSLLWHHSHENVQGLDHFQQTYRIKRCKLLQCSMTIEFSSKPMHSHYSTAMAQRLLPDTVCVLSGHHWPCNSWSVHSDWRSKRQSWC